MTHQFFLSETFVMQSVKINYKLFLLIVTSKSIHDNNATVSSGNSEQERCDTPQNSNDEGGF